MRGLHLGNAGTAYAKCAPSVLRSVKHLPETVKHLPETVKLLPNPCFSRKIPW